MSAVTSAPNVVPPVAAARIRALVFESRGGAEIAPVDFVPRLIGEGHGAQFDDGIRASRVLTWVKQVLRRLGRQGWVASGTDGRWEPTSALRECGDPRALSGKASRRLRRRAEVRAPETAVRPEPPPRMANAAAPAPEPGPSPPPRRDAETKSPRVPRPGARKKMNRRQTSPREAAPALEVDAVLASLREKRAAALEQAEICARMIGEIEAAARISGKANKPRKPRAGRPARPANAGKPRRKQERATPVKAEVSASEAILRLLSGCRMGLPASEVIQYVRKTHGYRPNSLRTTLYNLKKKGAIVQAEDGTYNHPENVG